YASPALGHVLGRQRGPRREELLLEELADRGTRVPVLAEALADALVHHSGKRERARVVGGVERLVHVGEERLRLVRIQLEGVGDGEELAVQLAEVAFCL